MTFDEWWTTNYPDGTGYGISRVAWDAALEEAAKMADAEAKRQNDRVLDCQCYIGVEELADAIRLAKK